MKLHALVVTKNEADRYLESALADLTGLVDEITVFDDQSTDDTVEIAKFYATNVGIRKEGPSFLEHEGQFRQASWDFFEYVAQPAPGDWVLSIDADEFIVVDDNVGRQNFVKRLCLRADEANRVAIRFHRPEVWQVFRSPATPIFQEPYIRTDGQWNKVICTRLFAYRPDGKVQDKAMGCGSEPTYVSQGKSLDSDKIKMLHYGYVSEDDVHEKYRRYASLLDHGHNDRHIQSIPARPTLEKWYGPTPLVYQGRKLW